MAKWPYCTSQWKRLRLAKLAERPVCHICELRGETTEANTVDHIIAISKGGLPFPEMGGLMALCHNCHAEKTANVDRWDNTATGRRFKGCSASGDPVDPADRWWGGGTNYH
jgi:5-methylcytosine-specific restriction protein A